MARKLAILLLPLLLLLAACTSGGDGKGDGAATSDDSTTNGSTPVVSDDQADPADPDTAASDDSSDTADPDVAVGDGAGGNGGDPFASVNPFDVLSGLNSAQPTLGGGDPALEAALLTSSDLPAGFLSLGSFNYSLPSEVGTIDLAASMFAAGDLESGDFNAMVMSTVMTLPPEALAELDSLRDFGQDDLDELAGLAGDAGLGFSELNVLDASGLGDAGFGLHMTMDLGAMLGAFGAPDGENPFPGGIAMDMYGFARGEQMLMVMVMWPAGQSSGVDARDLAETMDAKG